MNAHEKERNEALAKIDDEKVAFEKEFAHEYAIYPMPLFVLESLENGTELVDFIYKVARHFFERGNHFREPTKKVVLMEKSGFDGGAAWLASQGVTEVGTMGEFGIRLDKSVVSRLAETFKEGDRVVVQYRLLNK